MSSGSQLRINRIRYEFQVGIFVLVVLGLFVGSLYVLGSERQLFSAKRKFYAYFDDVKGLHSGASVRLGGISIGRVSDISFYNPSKNSLGGAKPPASQQTALGDKESKTGLVKRIRVELEVNEAFRNLVKPDAEVSIETQGLLGDKFVNLTLGAASKPAVEGAVIPATEPFEVQELAKRVGEILDKTTAAVEHVNVIVERVETEGIDKLLLSIEHLSKLVDSFSNGDGLLPRLISSSELADNVTSSSRDLASVMGEVRHGDGVLHELVFSDGGAQAVKSFENSMANIESITEELKIIATGYGEAGSDGETSFSTQLRSLLADLNRVSEALAQGQGSLGALIMDSSLYDNAVEITDSAKRNLIVREAVRQTIK